MSQKTQLMSGLWVSGLTLLLVSLFPFLLKAGQLENEKSITDQERHNVNVEVHLLPFYAVDAQNNPVYDLKAQDIELLIDKKKMDFIALSGFRLDSANSRVYSSQAKKTAQSPLPADAQTTAASVQHVPIANRQMGRYVFIVLDVPFCDPKGLQRAQRICNDILNRSRTNDVFTLLEFRIEQGISYVAGPTHNRKQLQKDIKNLVQAGMYQLKKRRMQFRNYGSGIIRKRNERQDIINAIDSRSAVLDLTEIESNSNWEAYTNMVRGNSNHLSYALKQLKYALKAINRPKMIYFVSGGVPPSTFPPEQFSSYLHQLGASAAAINQSGSLLYVVDANIENIQSNKNYSGKTMLMELARAGGGKYFCSDDVNKVSEELLNSSAAYYEIAIQPGKRKQMKVKINSKRPGVKIFSINQTEINRPYHTMKKLQQQLFALNVITGGTWSRMAGSVHKINFRQPNRPQNENGKPMTQAVSIQLPRNMHNRSLHLYTINLDPQTMKADFTLIHAHASDTLEIEGKIKKDKHLYFVVIDPQTTTCLFNRMM